MHTGYLSAHKFFRLHPLTHPHRTAHLQTQAACVAECQKLGEVGATAAQDAVGVRSLAGGAVQPVAHVEKGACVDVDTFHVLHLESRRSVGREVEKWSARLPHSILRLR